MASKKEDSIVRAEQEALEQWQKDSNEHLTLEESLPLYELYLNGNTAQDIFHLKNGKVPFGQIVDAKERYEWDKRKGQQLTSLFKKVEEKAVKAKADAVFYLTDALAVAHKQMGGKMQKYLETGDPSHLGATDFSSLKNYKLILEMLQILTASDKKDSKEINVGGTVQHQHNLSIDNSKTAANLLKLFDEGKIVDGEK